MLENYYKYKYLYKKYVVLLKIGVFYEAIDEDAVLLNKLFKYKIRIVNMHINVGFPINCLAQVKNKLECNNINYIVVERSNKKDYKITIEKSFIGNKYDNYKSDINKIMFNVSRIEKLYNFLIEMVCKDKIDITLSRIEKIL